MHDGSSSAPPTKGAASSASGAAPQQPSGLRGEELGHKGWLYVDQVGLDEFQLTDFVTQEIVALPLGHWYLEQWDDLEEVAVLGCYTGSDKPHRVGR